ncbi:MAG: hypothetical protein K8U57_28510 [Planctomycetes bacterium]|nr:hypothetical protein [Planctomycetota bacterium]
MTKKTPLNATRRQIIEEYGLKHIETTIDRTREHALLKQLVDETNRAIRAKYPESDMAVIRKYQLQRIDSWLQFVFPTGRVDGFTFSGRTDIADRPEYRGNYNSDVYVVTAEFEQAFDEHAKIQKASEKQKRERDAAFRNFVGSCRSVEDVLEVINLPADIRERLGHRSSALVAITPETVASLRNTFKSEA